MYNHSYKQRIAKIILIACVYIQQLNFVQFVYIQQFNFVQ